MSLEREIRAQAEKHHADTIEQLRRNLKHGMSRIHIAEALFKAHQVATEHSEARLRDMLQTVLGDQAQLASYHVFAMTGIDPDSHEAAGCIATDGNSEAIAKIMMQVLDRDLKADPLTIFADKLGDVLLEKVAEEVKDRANKEREAEVVAVAMAKGKKSGWAL